MFLLCILFNHLVEIKYVLIKLPNGASVTTLFSGTVYFNQHIIWLMCYTNLKFILIWFISLKFLILWISQVISIPLNVLYKEILPRERSVYLCYIMVSTCLHLIPFPLTTLLELIILLIIIFLATISTMLIIVIYGRITQVNSLMILK